MDGEASISLLTKAVADELQAVHQCLYFHFHLEDQGLGPLAVLFGKTAIEAAKQADSGTKQVFESLIADKERHFGRWDKQLGLVSHWERT